MGRARNYDSSIQKSLSPKETFTEFILALVQEDTERYNLQIIHRRDQSRHQGMLKVWKERVCSVSTEPSVGL